MASILVVDDRRAIAEGFGGKLVRYARENYERTVQVEIFCSSDDVVRRVSDQSLPQFGLVFTDIDLRDGDTPDRAGVALAKYVKAVSPDVPIVGYSGYFGETDLSDEETALFDQWWPKSDTRRHLDEMARDALERAFRHLKIPFRALPAGTVAAPSDGAASAIESPTTDGEFMALNYIKRVIEPTPLNGIKEPFAVWCKQSEEGVEMEVVGVSPLFAWGESVEDAEAGLLELIKHLAETTSSSSPKLSARLVEARRFAHIATGRR